MGLGRTVTDGKCMVVDIDDVGPNNFVSFQYYPLVLEPKRKAKLKPHQVAGRNLESYHFTGGSKSITIRFDFRPETDTREDILYRISWFEALTYNEGWTDPQHRVVIRFGDILTDEKWIVESVDSSMSLYDKRYELRPSLAYVEVTFMRWAEYTVKRSDILRKVLSNLPAYGGIPFTSAAGQTVLDGDRLATPVPVSGTTIQEQSIALQSGSLQVTETQAVSNGDLITARSQIENARKDSANQVFGNRLVSAGLPIIRALPVVLQAKPFAIPSFTLGIPAANIKTNPVIF